MAEIHLNRFIIVKLAFSVDGYFRAPQTEHICTVRVTSTMTVFS